MKRFVAQLAVFTTVIGLATGTAAQDRSDSQIFWEFPHTYRQMEPPKGLDLEPEKIPLHRVGEYRACLPTVQIQSTQVVNNRTVVFRLFGGDYWVNDFDKVCPALTGTEYVGYAKRDLHALCSGDMITAFTKTGLGPACPLGNFELTVRLKPQ